MSDEKTIELAHKAVENGFKKCSNAYSFLAPDILKQMVKSYAFDFLHEVCDESGEMKDEIDFYLFSSTVKKAIEDKFDVHFENPLS